MLSLSLYEILVPTIRKDGRPIHLRFHRLWDTKVRAISGGLTVCPPAKGQWLSPIGELFDERMIPVRIACTEVQIHAIADITLKHYEQDAVLYYLVTNQVFIRTKESASATTTNRRQMAMGRVRTVSQGP